MLGDDTSEIQVRTVLGSSEMGALLRIKPEFWRLALGSLADRILLVKN